MTTVMVLVKQDINFSRQAEILWQQKKSS